MTPLDDPPEPLDAGCPDDALRQQATMGPDAEPPYEDVDPGAVAP
jgi:hypothetical protein